MLKTRVIGVLIVKGGIVVQSIGFKRYLPVGSPAIAVEYLNRWGIDEIVMLDVDATPESRRPNYEKITEYATYCQAPLAVGGGITDLSDMERIIRSGADKVVINAEAISNPSLITEGARLYGSQCVVVSIDARLTPDGSYQVFTHSGKRSTGRTPTDLAKIAEEFGAGEILLNSIDRDGYGQGYDCELISQVVDSIHIPLVICGGAGSPSHFLEPIRLNVSGVAAANFFHYTEHSVVVAKSFLKSANANVRLETHTNYDGFRFDQHSRVAKVNDNTLEKLRFEYVPQEVI